MNSFGCIALAVTLAAIPPTAAQEDVAAGDALRARENALLARDSEAMLGLFTDDAIVVTSSGRLLVGKEQVAIWIQDQVERRQREEAVPRQKQGHKITWSGRIFRDDWQYLGRSSLEVRQDAIVENGKIRFFSTMFLPEAASRLEAARKKG